MSRPATPVSLFYLICHHNQMPLLHKQCSVTSSYILQLISNLRVNQSIYTLINFLWTLMQ
jgi:hypothetical protein